MTSRSDNREARDESAIRALTAFRKEVDQSAAALALRHAERLQCRAGCAQCCVDDLSVYEFEAEAIRRAYPELLATGVPHANGACAFLDEDQCCRVYAERPYVCRTQGLPLRWFDTSPGEDSSATVELRDICPLNLAGEPIESLPEEACWLLGPFEARMAEIAEQFAGRTSERVRLRDLFQRRS